MILLYLRLSDEFMLHNELSGSLYTVWSKVFKDDCQDIVELWIV